MEGGQLQPQIVVFGGHYDHVTAPPPRLPNISNSTVGNLAFPAQTLDKRQFRLQRHFHSKKSLSPASTTKTTAISPRFQATTELQRMSTTCSEMSATVATRRLLFSSVESRKLRQMMLALRSIPRVLRFRVKPDFT